MSIEPNLDPVALSFAARMMQRYNVAPRGKAHIDKVAQQRQRNKAARKSRKKNRR